MILSQHYNNRDLTEESLHSPIKTSRAVFLNGDDTNKYLVGSFENFEQLVFKTLRKPTKENAEKFSRALKLINTGNNLTNAVVIGGRREGGNYFTYKLKNINRDIIRAVQENEKHYPELDSIQSAWEDFRDNLPDKRTLIHQTQDAVIGTLTTNAKNTTDPKRQQKINEILKAEITAKEDFTQANKEQISAPPIKENWEIAAPPSRLQKIAPWIKSLLSKEQTLPEGTRIFIP